MGGATGEEHPFHCAQDSPWAEVKQMPSSKHVGPWLSIFLIQDKEVCRVVTALLASMDTSADVSDVIVVPPSPVLVLWVNPMALLVLFREDCCEEKAWKSLCVSMSLEKLSF